MDDGRKRRHSAFTVAGVVSGISRSFLLRYKRQILELNDIKARPQSIIQDFRTSLKRRIERLGENLMAHQWKSIITSANKLGAKAQHDVLELSPASVFFFPSTWLRYQLDLCDACRLLAPSALVVNLDDLGFPT